jgi:RNA polymerase sigma factor (TIGR02999 family)
MQEPGAKGITAVPVACSGVYTLCGCLPVKQAEPSAVTRLIEAWGQGDRSALDELIPILYAELRRLAASYMRRERSDHTLQPTGLVHEAYARLAGQARSGSHSRAQFFAVAANLMRQILVNHAERHRAAKRGGGNKSELEEDAAVLLPTGVDVLDLDTALQKLAQVDPRKSQIVELRFFGGLTEDGIAEVLGVSAITVKRDWRLARAMLRNELRAGELQPSRTRQQ